MRLLMSVVWYVLYALLIFIVIEWSLPRWIMPYLPPFTASLFDEPEGVWPLMQTSKKHGVAGESYWALLGDSYAKGMGDGQIDALAMFHARDYAVNHFLAQHFQRDVVSLAAPGSGSWRGLVANYAGSLAYLQAQELNWPERPELMIYFFYEGNDLVENHLFAQKVFTKRGLDTAAASEQVLQADGLFVRSQQASAKRGFLQQMAVNAYTQANREPLAFEHIGSDAGASYVPPKRWLPRMSGKSLNQAQIAGQTVALPGNLQGPAMELGEAELEEALSQFGQALQANRQRWSDIPLLVVYIPSVLSCYELTGPLAEAQNFLGDDTVKASVDSLRDRHSYVRESIERHVTGMQLEFLDASAALQAGCALEALHGPKDWNHLNVRGYRLLSQWLISELELLQQNQRI